ncbi:MAG: aminoacetone oxidase family FAD-binding enzyme, partial [Verrucomicrobia bacterium]|nr:aminoacetone oxidase family FAD-binding enzyme [Verrucomicrobiota bacterium]
TDLKECGPLLVTHAGLSGPAILRLSAWGARKLYDLHYEFPLRINWLPETNRDSLIEDLQARRETSGGQTILRTRWNPLPARLWESLVLQAGIAPDTKWARLSRADALKLAALLTSTELPVRGKSTNKEEFVTCGGIPLPEVDFKTMESRIVPGLHFAGEALDIDGITGGFNFQAAWTTGWIAGHAMAAQA